MIKIVNGKIVREGAAASPASSSPVPTRARRGSIQDIQMKEFEQEQLAKLASTQQQQQAEEEASAPITWTEILSLKISVFGLSLTAKNLLILSAAALAVAGLTGLLTSLLVLYIGTLFSNGIVPAQTSQATEEIPKANPILSLNSSPSSLRTSGGPGSSSPSLRTSGGSSSPLIRPIGSPSLRPLHPRLVTLKSLELDSLAIPTGTTSA